MFTYGLVKNSFKLLSVLCLVLFCVSGQAQEKKVYEIGFLVDHQDAAMLPLMQQLRTEIVAVVGEDATIVFPDQSVLSNEYNFAKAKQNYEQLLSNSTDIIIAFGAVNNQVVGGLTVHKKPTILFGTVSKELSKLNLVNQASGVANFTYLIESESYRADLKVFKELTGYKNLGVAVDAAVADILPYAEVFDKEMAALGAGYKLIPFKNISDIEASLDGVDALYMVGGFFLQEDQLSSLAKTLIAKKIPSFTVNGPDDVAAGLMGTNQSGENLEQFHRRLALTIEAYINGRPLSQLPVYIDFAPRLTINFNTADAIGIPLKFSLIGQTDFVGNPKNTVSDKEYSLLSAIKEGLDNNLSLRSNQKDVELKVQDIKSAKSNYLPAVTAAATGTYVDPEVAEISNGQSVEFSTAGAITLEQLLFSESANANIAIQKELQKAQQESFNAAELDLIFNISNAYFNALVLKANTQIQLRNVELTKKNLQIAEENFEAGQSGKSDLLRFRSQMAQNTQAMVEAINQLKQGFVALNQIVNNPTDTAIEIEDAVLDEGVFETYNYDEFVDLLDDPAKQEAFIDFLVDEANKNAPELRALGHNINAIARNIKLNGSGRFLPTLALQGQYNRVFSRSGAGSTLPMGFSFIDSNYNLGLSLSVPLINRNQNNINRQTALVQKEQLELNKENTELAISANIRNGVLNLINQVSNIELSKVSESTAQEALELNQVAYSNGAVNIVQLLDAQNNYLNAQLARANATYNFLLTSLQLERFLGYYFLLGSAEENNAFRQRFFEFLNNRN